MSVVVATHNRPASLARLLASLRTQTAAPSEIIIVDSSDTDATSGDPASSVANAACSVVRTDPHVCKQRNIGISAATGRLVLLCDDDMELPPNYIEELRATLDAYTECCAASGLILERGTDGTFDSGWRPMKAASLIWAFVFQLGLWSDLEKIQPGSFPKCFLIPLLKRYYAGKGNAFSLAGWPLVTRSGSPFFRTEVYALGASLIRREFLLKSPFDETLGTRGIGDNYGVCLGFQSPFPVVVNTNLGARHHKSSQNRLSAGETYFHRVLAMDYFMRQDPRFGIVNRIFLLWSVFGHLLVMTVRGNRDLRRCTARTIRELLFQKHPTIVNKAAPNNA